MLRRTALISCESKCQRWISCLQSDLNLRSGPSRALSYRNSIRTLGSYAWFEVNSMYTDRLPFRIVLASMEHVEVSCLILVSVDLERAVLFTASASTSAAVSEVNVRRSQSRGIGRWRPETRCVGFEHTKSLCSLPGVLAQCIIQSAGSCLAHICTGFDGYIA